MCVSIDTHINTSFQEISGRLELLAANPPAGAGVSDSGLVDSHQRLVSMSRSAALNNTSVAFSSFSLPACVSHLSPCPLAVSDISSASQMSDGSPPIHSAADVVSRCSGIDPPRLSCHASSSGLE